MDIIYFGLFVSHRDIQVGQLFRDVEHKHITLEFRPKVVPMHLLGKEFILDLVGFGLDGINEGFSVEVPEELVKYYKGAEVPHITLSVAKGGSAVDTAFLEFNPIERVQVKGTLGVFTRDGLILSK